MSNVADPERNGPMVSPPKAIEPSGATAMALALWGPSPPTRAAHCTSPLGSRRINSESRHCNAGNGPAGEFQSPVVSSEVTTDPSAATVTSLQPSSPGPPNAVTHRTVPS